MEAYAVDGTPADSAMVGLAAPVWRSAAADPAAALADPNADGATRAFDLVVSGINAGDNLGYHAIYSGTVGAAREGALSARAALALSLDDHRARDPALFAHAADVGAAMVGAMLDELERYGGGGGGGGGSAAASAAADQPSNTTPPTVSPLVGRVVNVNVPADNAVVTALCLAHQGGHCWRPGFEERFVRVASGDPPSSPRGVADGGAPPPGTPGLRFYFNVGGAMWKDATPGSDTWAVKKGYASVTCLNLKQEVVTSDHADALADGDAAVAATARVVEGAAARLGVGVRKGAA